jgi:hypothetical protein
MAARFTVPPRSAPPAVGERAVDPGQDLDQVGAGAAAGVEDVDVVGREAVGDAKLVAQHPVDPLDHVADDLARRVPDPELLPQLGVEGGEERLVEVLDRLALVEAGEERLARHPVEGGLRPAHDLDQAERPEPAGLGELVEEGAEHRHLQVPARHPPVERLAARRVLAHPQDPGREQAVEERLDQGGVEEVPALAGLEGDAERLLQRGLDLDQRR